MNDNCQHSNQGGYGDNANTVKRGGLPPTLSVNGIRATDEAGFATQEASGGLSYCNSGATKNTVTWRCPNCETVTDKDKCPVCGSPKPVAPPEDSKKTNISIKPLVIVIPVIGIIFISLLIQLIGISHKDYDAQGRLTSIKTVGILGQVKSATYYTYHEDGSWNEKIYGKTGLSQIVYYGSDNAKWGIESYNSEGRISQISLYNEDGTKHISLDCDYDPDVGISVSYDDFGIVSMVWVEEYNAKGKPVREIVFDEEGKLYSTYEYSYGTTGKLAESRRYNPDGTLGSVSCYNNAEKEIRTDYYENGAIQFWTLYEYKSDGSYESFTYFEEGQVFDKTEFDSDGNETRSILYSYRDGELSSYTVYEPLGDASGYYVRREYDANGALLEEVVDTY